MDEHRSARRYPTAPVSDVAARRRELVCTVDVEQIDGPVDECKSVLRQRADVSNPIEDACSFKVRVKRQEVGLADLLTVRIVARTFRPRERVDRDDLDAARCRLCENDGGTPAMTPDLHDPLSGMKCRGRREERTRLLVCHPARNRADGGQRVCEARLEVVSSCHGVR